MTNQQGAPEALRTITRYEVVDCIDSKHVPAVIPNKDGPWVRYEDHLAALVEAQQPAPSAAAANTKTAELLSTTVGLLMGYREGGARQPYKQGSVVAKVIDEVVDHLKDWPYPEPSPTPQADSAPAAAPADTVVLEAALRAIHQAIDLIGEPDTERLRTVRRVLRGAVVVAEDSTTPQPAPAVDGCTDPYSCKRCMTHPDHRGDMEHAGIPVRDVARAARAPAKSVPPMTAADAQRYAEIEASSGANDFAAGIPQAADSVLEDAARYRWLREQGTTTYIMRHRRYENCIQLLSDMGGELADAAIDAARKQGGAR